MWFCLQLDKWKSELMAQGKCALCLEDTALRKSHIMPKGMYNAIKSKSTLGDNDLIMIDGGTTAVLTSSHLKERLLCGDCERKLDKNGERYFSSVCNQYGTGFRLREILANKKHQKIYSGNRIWYGENISTIIKLEEIKYFIVSILWRFSISSKGRATRYKGALGLQFSEKFREYLNGEKPFPSNVFLKVDIDFDEEPLSILSFPMFRKLNAKALKMHLHEFKLSGLDIHAYIGGDTSKMIKEFSTEVVFFETFFQKTKLAKNISKATRAATPKGKLVDEWIDL